MSSDEWTDTLSSLNVLFDPLDAVTNNRVLVAAEKFKSAEHWLEGASDRIAELRLSVSEDNLPRFEQVLRSKMSVFWDIDQRWRDEIVAHNMQTTAGG